MVRKIFAFKTFNKFGKTPKNKSENFFSCFINIMDKEKMLSDRETKFEVEIHDGSKTP